MKQSETDPSRECLDPRSSTRQLGFNAESFAAARARHYQTNPLVCNRTTASTTMWPTAVRAKKHEKKKEFAIVFRPGGRALSDASPRGQWQCLSRIRLISAISQRRGKRNMYQTILALSCAAIVIFSRGSVLADQSQASIAVACVEHADCDDGDPCTVDVCVESACVNIWDHPCCLPSGPCWCQTNGDCPDGWCCNGLNEVCVPEPCPGTGDFDADGDLDHVDAAAFGPCSLGAGVKPVDPLCARLDLTGDGAVDLRDVARFQWIFSVCLSWPDADNDGVSDGCDECPNTFPGTVVDQHGCNG
jgi:hypothetical protein